VLGYPVLHTFVFASFRHTVHVRSFDMRPHAGIVARRRGARVVAVPYFVHSFHAIPDRGSESYASPFEHVKENSTRSACLLQFDNRSLRVRTFGATKPPTHGLTHDDRATTTSRARPRIDSRPSALRLACHHSSGLRCSLAARQFAPYPTHIILVDLNIGSKKRDVCRTGRLPLRQRRERVA